MDKAPTSSDSTNKLHDAIRKLEAYSLQQMESEAPSVSKTMSLMRSMLANRFDFHPKEHRHKAIAPDNSEVLMAIELINRNRFFIEKLKEGTPAEQELAEKIAQTINSYNDSCDKRIQRCVSGRERLVHFFSNEKHKSQHLPKITLPKKVTVQCHYPENPASAFMHKITTSNTQLPVSLSLQSAQLFHMKAIALMESFYGITSNPEERMSVMKSPIHVDFEENATVCTLTQTLSLFPGQTIVVKGKSALNPLTRTVSQLFPESFCLSLESTQTGFPHPVQRAGWSVASQIVPEFPQRIDLLDKTADLFQGRNQIVVELLKQGTMITQAKELLSLKKKSFSLHAKELIDLHKTLALAILQAACASPAACETVENFFQTIHSHPQPLDVLAAVSKSIGEYFMVRPHQTLLNAIIKGKSTDLGSAIPEMRYATAKAILNQSIDDARREIGLLKAGAEQADERLRWDYVACMGEVLGRASNQIYLQYLSEDLMYNPPSLTSFENQVQASAYSHLKDFLSELTSHSEHTPESVYQLLKGQIVSDISIFRNESPDTISRELADYFQNRYLSLNTL